MRCSKNTEAALEGRHGNSFYLEVDEYVSGKSQLTGSLCIHNDENQVNAKHLLSLTIFAASRKWLPINDNHLKSKERMVEI